MTMIVETLAYIETPITARKPFAAGIILFDDKVVEAAHIVGYMKKQKWTRDRVREHCQRNGWTIRVVHQFERERP